MPFIAGHNQILGYAAFCGVKFVGYSLYARLMKRAYVQPSPNTLLVGATRTLIGMVVGAIYFLVGRGLESASHGGDETLQVLYFGMLVPIRIAEWWLLIRIFFFTQEERTTLHWKLALGGVLWSFLLDVPAILGFCITSGVSVC